MYIDGAHRERLQVFFFLSLLFFVCSFLFFPLSPLWQDHEIDRQQPLARHFFFVCVCSAAQDIKTHQNLIQNESEFQVGKFLHLVE